MSDSIAIIENNEFYCYGYPTCSALDIIATIGVYFIIFFFEITHLFCSLIWLEIELRCCH